MADLPSPHPSASAFVTAVPGATFIPQGSAPGFQPGAMATAILPGGPGWLTWKNVLITGVIGGAAYFAYTLLLPPKKAPAAVVSGLGRLFGRRRRRRRHRR